MKLRFTIGRRIGIGFAVLIFLTLVAFVLTLKTINESRSITEQVTDRYTPSVLKLKDLNQLIARSRILIYGWILQEKDDYPDKPKLRKLIDEEYPVLRKEIEDISEQWTKEEKEVIRFILEDTDALFDMYREVMDILDSFAAYQDPSEFFPAKTLAEEDAYDKSKPIFDKLELLIESQQNSANHVTTKMLSQFTFLENAVKVLSVILMLGGIIIAVLTVRSIVSPIAKLKRMLLSMGKGVLPDTRIAPRNDEIGEMSVALNGLIEGLSSTTEFARAVGAGNFESFYKPLSNDDTLGHALLKMRVDLAENERVLERKVIERTEQVVRQKQEIEDQNEKLEVLYKHVTDSIKYAKRIQLAILPPESLVRKLLPNSFVLYKPKDIVSGDFYWLHEKGGKVLFATVDCTGHGVPGAFMSIVGHNLLKRVVTNTDRIEPASILDALNDGVTETLHNSQDEVNSKDGMDLSLCSLDYKTLELQFAGAFNPLYLIRDGTLREIKADKFPIGFFEDEIERKFSNHKIQLMKGDMIYIFSDGYADQFGGPNGKKFMAKKFRDTLIQIHQLAVGDQKKMLDRTIESWKGTLDQVDDMLIWGVKI